MSFGRTLRAQAPFTLVLLVVAAGFCYSGLNPQHWLRGVSIVAAGLLLGGLLRAVLPERRAGLLHVRSRLFDVFCLVVLGAGVLGFGVVQPR
jgi:hypothetical protein